MINQPFIPSLLLQHQSPFQPPYKSLLMSHAESSLLAKLNQQIIDTVAVCFLWLIDWVSFAYVNDTLSLNFILLISWVVHLASGLFPLSLPVTLLLKGFVRRKARYHTCSTPVQRRFNNSNRISVIIYFIINCTPLQLSVTLWSLTHTQMKTKHFAH